MPATSIRGRATGALLFLLPFVAACGTSDPGSDLGPPSGPDEGVEAADDGPLDAGVPRRVLFIGNSYTFFHDLPSMVAAIGSATPGGAVEVESITAGGATLFDHWSNPEVQARIQQGDLETVVVQGQSLEPVFGEGFTQSGILLGDLVNEAGAEGVWFSTWARRADHEIYESGLLTRESLTEALEFGYRSLARPHGDLVARVGAAWLIALDELPDVTLFESDGSHPAPPGSWLAACVIHQAITGLPPQVPAALPDGVSSDVAEALCAIAPRVICPEDRDFCDGACVDPQRDPLHCGGCGNACDGEDPCQEGVCGCAEGLSGCGFTCYDLDTSVFHCGECDVRCSGDELCAAGDCSCASAAAVDFTFDDLVALDADCGSWNDAGSLACRRAAHARCADFGCFASGVPPLTGHAPRWDVVTCTAGEMNEPTYAELAAQEPSCDGPGAANTPACVTAISRWCASEGAVSGYGPATVDDEGLTVTCVTEAEVVHTTSGSLQDFASRCVTDPVTCSAAAWNFCDEMGFVGGFGPVEADGEERDVVCLRR